MSEETVLKGGRSNSEVVKMGNTVHRNLSANSNFVHKLLTLLEVKGFKYSPRFLGIDKQGREILSYIEGEIAHGEYEWTDEKLIKITNILRDFHDTTKGISLVGSKEVVCHNDFAPWNIVLKDSNPVAVIDFDDAEPGKVIEDLAYMLWTFLELGSDFSPQLQAKRIKLVCDTYGFTDIRKIIPGILHEQKKILKKRIYLSKNDISEEKREFSKYKVTIIKSEIDWIKRNRKIIEKILEKN